MRRMLTGSTFLRVYVLLAVALLVTFGLALGSFMLVDQVRREHYHERLASPPMTLLVAQLAAQPVEAREQWLSQQSRRLDIALELRPIRGHFLDYFERSRLEAGHTLVEPLGEDGWRLQRQLPGEPWILTATLTDLKEHQLLALGELLGSWLAEVEGKRRLARLERLQSSVMPVTLSDTPPPGFETTQLEGLSDAEVVIRLLPQRWAVSLYLSLAGDDGERQWVEVGPLDAFESMPLSLSVLLAVVILLCLTGAIYVIVRGVEARVSRLELAATRIASGRLDTRVKVESSDFLGRLGMAFNGMATQVQLLLSTQQDMIRAVSHELRTPVARIRFAVQIVEDMTEEPAVRRQLEGIDGDIEELDGLIDEILTYARLGSDSANDQGMTATLVDCRIMAQRVIEALRPLHGHLVIELADGPEVEARADPRYLQRALQNLVANACRHARRRVMIRVHGESRQVRLDVEDDGPGVPPSQRLDVFKPFARLDDSRTRSSGGYGLGLSIVQKVMSWHGGSAAVDDSPELGGARFTLLLPQ